MTDNDQMEEYARDISEMAALILLGVFIVVAIVFVNNLLGFPQSEFNFFTVMLISVHVHVFIGLMFFDDEDNNFPATARIKKGKLDLDWAFKKFYWLSRWPLCLSRKK